MPTQYYISRNDKVRGPFSEERVRELYAEGKLRDTDFLSTRSDGGWKPVETALTRSPASSRKKATSREHANTNSWQRRILISAALGLATTAAYGLYSLTLSTPQAGGDIAKEDGNVPETATMPAAIEPKPFEKTSGKAEKIQEMLHSSKVPESLPKSKAGEQVAQTTKPTDSLPVITEPLINASSTKDSNVSLDASGAASVFAIEPIHVEISPGRFLNIRPNHESALICEVFKAFELMCIGYQIDSFSIDKIDLNLRGVRPCQLAENIEYRDNNLPINNYTFTWVKDKQSYTVQSDRIIDYKDKTNIDPAFEELLAIELLLCFGEKLFYQYFVFGENSANPKYPADKYYRFRHNLIIENGGKAFRNLEQGSYFQYYFKYVQEIIKNPKLKENAEFSKLLDDISTLKMDRGYFPVFTRKGEVRANKMLATTNPFLDYKRTHVFAVLDYLVDHPERFVDNDDQVSSGYPNLSRSNIVNYAINGKLAAVISSAECLYFLPNVKSRGVVVHGHSDYLRSRNLALMDAMSTMTFLQGNDYLDSVLLELNHDTEPTDAKNVFYVYRLADSFYKFGSDSKFVAPELIGDKKELSEVALMVFLLILKIQIKVLKLVRLAVT